MQNLNKCCSTRQLFLVVAVAIYFVIFPQDLAALLGPLRIPMEMSNILSPWAYGLIGVAFICWTLVRIWGRPAGRA